jgi:hypothetical protein
LDFPLQYWDCSLGIQPERKGDDEEEDRPHDEHDNTDDGWFLFSGATLVGLSIYPWSSATALR